MSNLQALVEDVSVRSPLLMTPGPTEVEQRVLDTLATRPMMHYGETWKTLYESTLDLLRNLFDSEEDDRLILVPAPGSACLEMAISNLVKPNQKILNLRNGYFGEITRECAERHRIKVIEHTEAYGRPIHVDDVKLILETVSDISAIVVVHNETSTGVVNPVEEISVLASKHGVPLIVDAVSSFGATNVSTRKWNTAVCIGYASKGLAGIAGIVPVSIDRKIWERISKDNDPNSAGRFLSFQIWDRYIREWGSWGHPYPTTMPTSAIKALNLAAKIAIEEGIEARAERHKRISKKLREKVRQMRLQLLASDECASTTVTSVSIPSPLQDKLRIIMEKDLGVVISGGLSELKGKIVRVGHMGATATDACIERTANAIERGLTIAKRETQIV